MLENMASSIQTLQEDMKTLKLKAEEQSREQKEVNKEILRLLAAKQEPAQTPVPMNFHFHGPQSTTSHSGPQASHGGHISMGQNAGGDIQSVSHSGPEASGGSQISVGQQAEGDINGPHSSSLGSNICIPILVGVGLLALLHYKGSSIGFFTNMTSIKENFFSLTNMVVKPLFKVPKLLGSK